MSTILIRQLDGLVQGSGTERSVVSMMRLLAPLFRPINFKGYSRVCRKIADGMLPGAEAEVRLDPDTVFAFPLNDTYWVRLITTSFKYEPEIANILMLIRRKKFSFIDCGANFGYWSCLVSSDRYGNHQAIAIEPSAGTFVQLEKNASLNGGRFITEKVAISDQAGVAVKLGGSSHAARSIISGDGESVITATIDDLVRKYNVTEPLVIKLDVEGVEIRALEGARKALATSPLLLYEDHGSDPMSRVSAYLLDKGWQLFTLGKSQPEPVRSVSEVNAVKTDSRVGYNFAAVKDRSWL